MKLVPLIMAGGKGERFWPRSRRNLPKQFLKLAESDTMLQATIKRLSALAPPEDMYIVTGSEYVDLTLQQIPEISAANILVEPMGRNTAACICLAALRLSRIYTPDTILLITPSDHLVTNPVLYCQTVEAAARLCTDHPDALITMGIRPSRPETAYGYLRLGETLDFPSVRGAARVEAFIEKPDHTAAADYVLSGNYLWNSGVFIGKISTVLDHIRKYLPEHYHTLSRVADPTSVDTDQLGQAYERLTSISFDFGVMEKAPQVLVVPGEFGWDDVGSWRSLERLNVPDEAGNAVVGNAVLLESQGCIVHSEDAGKLIALLGVDNMLVVDTPDVTLICPKSQTQQIRKLIETIQEQQSSRYL